MTLPKTITKEWFNKHHSGDKQWFSSFINGSNIHPNPKFYKYYWWIYDEQSAFANAGEVFYKEQYRLTTKEFLAKEKELYEKNIRFCFVNEKYHRLGNPIWDYEKLRLKYPDMKFAPSIEDDEDENLRS